MKSYCWGLYSKRRGLRSPFLKFAPPAVAARAIGYDIADGNKEIDFSSEVLRNVVPRGFCEISEVGKIS
jgi:hypothetical protein